MDRARGRDGRAGTGSAVGENTPLQALHIDRRDLLGGLIHEYERAAA